MVGHRRYPFWRKLWKILPPRPKSPHWWKTQWGDNPLKTNSQQKKKNLEKIIKKLYLKLKELLKNTQKFQMLHCIALSCILGKLKYLHNMVTSSKCPSVPRCPPSNVPQYGDVPTELGRDGGHIFQIYHTSGNPRKNPQRWKGPWDTGKVGQQRYMKFILMVFSK